MVITGSRDGWYEVAVPGQPNPKNAAGYPGWIPRNQVSTTPLPDSRVFALVHRSTTAWLYADPALTRRSREISVNTRLPLLDRTPTALHVRTPGGPLWLPAASAGVFGSDREIPRPTRADLVRFATLFVGKPYLWAGRSGPCTSAAAG